MIVVEEYYYLDNWMNETKCKLEIDELKNIVIATELADNLGSSISVSVEYLIFWVCRSYKLDKNKLIWIEKGRRMIDGGKKLWYRTKPAQVNFTVVDNNITNPVWTDVEEELIKELLK